MSQTILFSKPPQAFTQIKQGNTKKQFNKLSYQLMWGSNLGFELQIGEVKCFVPNV